MRVLTLMWMSMLIGCGSRVAVYHPGDDGWGYELPQSDGECSTDLGCMTNGCGNHCTSTDAESFIGSCEYASHLDFSECGCVDTTCRWYAGPLTIQGAS